MRRSSALLMTGLYVKLDADYASDPKIMRAGASAELVYVRGLALAKRLVEADGHIDRAQLGLLTLGVTGSSQKIAGVLVREGLWTETDRKSTRLNSSH